MERTTKRAVGVALLAAALLAGPRTAFAHRVEDSRRWSMPAENVRALEIENECGNITVERWKRDSIVVDARIRVKAPGKSKARALLESITFQVTRREDVVAIGAVLPRIRQDAFGFGRGDFTSIRIRYRIRAPESLDLRLSTSSGRIEEVSNE